MGTRNVSKQADALARARDRRRELDRARDEQDARIEEATASVLVALEARAEAEGAVREATTRVGAALRLVLAEEVSVERAAALVDIDVSDVRRFVRAASGAPERESSEGSPATRTGPRTVSSDASVIELSRAE